MDSITINGVKTYCFSSRKELIDFAFVEKKSLIAVNAEKILHATDQTRKLFNKSIGYSDGIGAVWALKKKGFKNAVKIPGCELWLDIIRTSFGKKTFYLVGAQQEVVERTVAKLRQDFPGINIVNYRNGFISSDAERRALLDDISVRKPDVIFIAMGSPKQEMLIEEMMQIHPAVYQGLGGSFDVYVGHVQRAPEWWVKNNLEWAYRLVKQPSRIKRQIHLVRFAWLLLINKI
ncbi:MAG: WecB/TagA/CpsF family glycosyltransferase [Bacteroidales bacterium]|nr:WecB/TagA/CpsF family glycosyltransferase [Bacteroidales bacterium]